MIDPLVLVAHAISSNKGVYAVLVGSGLSRSAGIPTGWEITLELVRRVAAGEGVAQDLSGDAAAVWFRSAKGTEPEYTTLLDQLASTPEERRGILDGFIAPTPEDRDAGIKVPTVAHRAIARLVAGGFIRVILTTNFDRLIETALHEVGIEPTVIASADDAAGAVPLTHAGCVVIKLHGDYLDTRILNTAAELAAYAPGLLSYLDRVLDEFGLVVVGWSAEWDDALRSAIARCPNRRFSTWWAARGGRLTDRGRSLVAARQAQIIDIIDADHFLADVEQKVLAIEDLKKPHPLSAKVAVAELKRYLLDPTQQIRQHDLVFGETKTAVERAAAIGGISVRWSEDEFRRRVEAIESFSEILRSLALTGARWGRADDEAQWPEIVRRSCQSYQFNAGLDQWIQLQRYLPMLLFYAVGLGAIVGEHYQLLQRLFETPAPIGAPGSISAVENLLPLTAFSNNFGQCWNLLTAPRASALPVNDRILNVIDPQIADLVSSRSDLVVLFDRFEVLASLSRVHLTTASDYDPRIHTWFVPGMWYYQKENYLYGGKSKIRDWLAQADSDRENWPPLAAGMFGGNYERFSKLRAGFENYMRTVT